VETLTRVLLRRVNYQKQPKHRGNYGSLGFLLISSLILSSDIVHHSGKLLTVNTEVLRDLNS